MNRQRTRWLSFLLAVTMVLAMLPPVPLTVRAAENPWNGRSAVFVGDSITAGSGTDKRYYEFLEESLGFGSVTAMGVAGSCVSAASDYGNSNQPLVDRYQNIPSADLVVLFIGTNDYGHETPLGTASDTQDGTFYGALNTIVPALVAGHPFSKIIFTTPLHRYGFGTSKLLGTKFTYDSIPNGVGATLGDYAAALKAVCEKHGVSVIDLYAEYPLDPSDAATRTAYMPDGLHPNASGHKLIAQIMESHIRSYSPLEKTPEEDDELVYGNRFASGFSQQNRASSRINYYLEAGTVITLKDPAAMQWACARTSDEYSSNNLGYFPEKQWADIETAVVAEDGWVGFTFKYRDETQVFDLTNPLSDYISIHTHAYENGVCTVCGHRAADSGLTHAVPENVGVQNAIDRAYLLTDIEWTPLADVPGVQEIDGEYTVVPFEAGVTYRGIPYSGVTANDCYVGLNVSLESFLTALQNRNSVLYTENLHSTNPKSATYFGTVCSKFAQYVLDIPGSYNTNNVANIPGMETIALPGEYTVDQIRLGDVVLNTATHTTVCTDILYDAEGNVAYIEISEAVMPLVRRMLWSPEEFYEQFADYRLCRYQCIDEVPAAGDVRLDSGYALMPRYGDKFNYKVSAARGTVDVLESGYHKAVVLRDGAVADEIILNGAASFTFDRSVPGNLEMYLERADGTRSGSVYACVVRSSVSVTDCSQFALGKLTVAIDGSSGTPLYVQVGSAHAIFCNVKGMEGIVELTFPTSRISTQQVRVAYQNEYGIYLSSWVPFTAAENPSDDPLLSQGRYWNGYNITPGSPTPVIQENKPGYWSYTMVPVLENTTYYSEGATRMWFLDENGAGISTYNAYKDSEIPFRFTTPAGTAYINVAYSPDLVEQGTETLTHVHDYRAAVTLPTRTERGFTIYTCACGDSYRTPWLDERAYEGRTIACIGDSITAAVGVTKDENDYVKLLAERLGMDYIRLGASGTTLCTDGSRTCNIGRLTEGYLNGADVVTIAMGINDFCAAGTGYYELGDIDSTDSSTIYGAVRMWCERIVELRNTDSLRHTQFYFVTPLITSWNNSVTSGRNWDQSKTNIHGYTLRDLCNAIMEVAALYDVAVIDLNLVSGLYYVSAEDNNTAVFGGDGVHPGVEGHGMMARAIANALLQNDLRDDHEHTFGSWITTTWPSCAEGRQQRVCTVCTATESRTVEPAAAHTYTAAVTTPTCTERGFTTYTCACGDSYVADFVEARGYDWMLEDGEFKILLIGNSFSEDASNAGMPNSQMLDIFQAMLGEDVKVTVGLCYSGGKGLNWHATQSELGNSSYSLRVISTESGAWQSCGASASADALTWTDWDVVSLQHYEINTTTGKESNAYPDQVDPKFDNLEAATEFMLDHVDAHAPNAAVYFYMHWARAYKSKLNESLSTYNDMAEFFPVVLGYTGTESANRFETIIPVGLSVQNARTTYLALLAYNTTAYADGNLNLYTDAQIGLQRDGGHLSYNIGRYIAALTFAETIIPDELRTEGYVLPDIRITESVGRLPKEYTTIAQKSVAAAVNSWAQGSLAVTEISGYSEDPIFSAAQTLENTSLVLNCDTAEGFASQICKVLPTDFAVDTVALADDRQTVEVTIRFGYTSKTVTVSCTVADHTYEAVVTAPACTERGYTTYTCRCGDSYVDNYVDATGHRYGEWNVTTTPTCTEPGQERRDCEICDHHETREVAATGHNYKSVVTDPTCTEKGFTTHTCACGDSFVDTWVDALGHQYGDWNATTAPTCTESGWERRSCENCVHFETREVAATGHDYRSVATEPTCTEKGFTTHTCACGDSFVDSWVDALGHSWSEWEVIQEPTTAVPGLRQRVCGNCGATEDEEIPRLEITYGDINGDGRINTLDLIILRQFLAGWDVEADMDASDVNGNGSVNTLDLIILRQYLAGWDVTLGPA